MKAIITSLIVCFGILSINAQSNYINYQGVARDGSGNLIENQNINIKLDIKFDTDTATPSYTETHNITTDANGIFSLQIGNGSADFGIYDELSWGNQKAFITTSIDGTEAGTTEMHAVPFALNAGGTGLEAIDEGNGVGWRLKGSNPDNHGNIGFQSVDLSYQNNNSDIKGATNWYSLATGTGTEASGFTSTAMGTRSFATGNYSFAVGNTPVASGNASFATGINSFAQSIAETTIGSYNEIYTPSPGGANNWDENDRLFTIGNGPTFDNRSNAFIVLKNGTITAPSFDISEITDDKALITKEYLENNSTNKIDDLEDGKSDTDGSSLFIGINSGVNDNGTNNKNTAIGFNALGANTSGSNNTSTGWNSLESNTFGSNNTAFGAGALRDNTTGNSNTALGSGTLGKNTTGGNNIAIGSSSLFNNTGSQNIAIGVFALFDNTTGGNNTAIGYQSLSNNTTGENNTALGADVLVNNNGDGNTAIGVESLNSNTTGESNVGVGYGTLFSNTIGSSNSSLGNGALFSNTNGSGNNAFGRGALGFNTVGDSNTAIGSYSLFNNLAGSTNTAVGNESLMNNNNGEQNVAVGYSSLKANANGTGNTSVGWLSLSQSTFSNSNTAIGRMALNNLISGNNNIGIGNSAQVSNANGSNQVRIGNTAITYAGIQVAWTVTSDKRWKEQVRQLPYGLNMTQQLKPVDYIRKNNYKKTREIGFIAQDVEKVLKNLGYNDQGFLTKDDNGYISLRYNDLIPVLTKAIQEQQQMIQQLQKANKTQSSILEKQNEKYESLLSKVEVIEKKLLANTTTFNN